MVWQPVLVWNGIKFCLPWVEQQITMTASLGSCWSGYEFHLNPSPWKWMSPLTFSFLMSTVGIQHYVMDCWRNEEGECGVWGPELFKLNAETGTTKFKSKGRGWDQAIMSSPLCRRVRGEDRDGATLGWLCSPSPFFFPFRHHVSTSWLPSTTDKPIRLINGRLVGIYGWLNVFPWPVT